MAMCRFILSLTLLVVLIGCHGRPVDQSAGLGRLSGYDNRPGSLVLMGQGPQAEADSAVPWYAWRNDIGPSVIAGYQSTIYEQSTTYTRDRQIIIGGRVYDRYDQTTYRRTVRDSVR